MTNPSDKAQPTASDIELVRTAVLSLKGCALGYAADGNKRLMNLANDTADEGLKALDRILNSHRALVDALKKLLKAEWMVTHDWGGDREAVKEMACKALRAAGEDV